MDNIQLRIKADRAIRSCLANSIGLIKLASYTYNKATDDYSLSIYANDDEELHRIDKYLFDRFELKNGYVPESDRWLVYNGITEEKLEEITVVASMLGN